MKRILLLFCVLTIGLNSFSQNRDSKWTVALSGSLVNFGDTGGISIGDQFLFQVPKISFSTYIIPSITFDLSTTISTLKDVEGFYSNNFNYFSIDGSVRYDFGASRENLVPYIGIGIGWIGAPQTIQGSNATPTTNFLFGGTYWFAPKFGFNAEFIYKNSQEQYESMRSHSQVSFGLVYSFKPRQLVQRLWHRR